MRNHMTRFFSVALTLALALGAFAQPIQEPSAGDGAATVSAPQAPPPGQRGHFNVVQERIWVSGGIRRVWVDAVFTTAPDAHGNQVRILVEPGHYRDVKIPGRYEVRERKVWVPDPTPVPSTVFTFKNTRRFQVQLWSIRVVLADGGTAVIALPADRVISSQKHFTFDLPANAVTVSMRFKTWDWGNRRFRFPIYGADYALSRGSVGLIH